jgi:drug/metabolite transporter (DMT)-like permease
LSFTPGRSRVDSVISEPATARPVWTVPAAVVTTLLAWASAFVAIRAVGDTFSPGPLALLRLVVGTLALTAFVALRRGRLTGAPTARSRWLIAAYGVAWFAGYTAVLNAAERHLDAGTAAMLVNVAPILVAVGAGALLGEGWPRPLLVGILVSFTGVAIIAVDGTSGRTDRVGVVLGLVAAVLYAAGVLVQKVALRTTDPVTATWLGCAVGTAVLLPSAPQALRELAVAGPGAIGAVVYLGLVPTAVGFVLWAYALTRVPAGSLTATTLTVPGIVVLMSWVLLGELPSLVALGGGVLALAGVAIARRSARARRPAAPAGAARP